MGKKGKTTRASATIKIHFGVSKAENSGYRHFVERQGRLVRGSRKIRILDTKWYSTQTEAEKGLLRQLDNGLNDRTQLMKC